jgi:hypothetical protein
MHRLVGHGHMQRIAVGVGIDRHRRNAHLLGGLDDPAGDFATVGDQDLGKHALLPPLMDLPARYLSSPPKFRRGFSRFRRPSA